MAKQSIKHSQSSNYPCSKIIVLFFIVQSLAFLKHKKGMVSQKNFKEVL